MNEHTIEVDPEKFHQMKMALKMNSLTIDKQQETIEALTNERYKLSHYIYFLESLIKR